VPSTSPSWRGRRQRSCSYVAYRCVPGDARCHRCEGHAADMMQPASVFLVMSATSMRRSSPRDDAGCRRVPGDIGRHRHMKVTPLR
jgi:hypothetical protein